MEVVRYFTKEQLVSASNDAKARGGRYVPGAEKLPAKFKYPVFHTALHNDSEIRVQVLLNEKGKLGIVDVPLTTFNNLKTVSTSTAH